MLFDLEETKKTSLDQYVWVKDNHIHMSKEALSEIKENFSRDDIFAFMAKLIKDKQLPFPYFPYNRRQQKKKFSQLRIQDRTYLREKWENQNIEVHDLSYRGGYLLLPTSTMSGNSLSDLFTQPIRLKATRNLEGRNERGTLPFIWQDLLDKGEVNPRTHRLLRNAYLEDKFDQKTFIRAGRLSGQMVTQFRPSVAKALYDLFDAQNVLDLSAGWGDRLVGFLASEAKSYIGIDPNTQLHQPYDEIHKFYDPSRSVKTICMPSEDVDYSELEYDFVFTSPPYFNVELYCNEDTQSIKRYSDFEVWKERYLFATLGEVYKHLKVGGRIALNICDNPKLKVTKDLISFMDSLGATYEGIVGYEINIRPGAVRQDHGSEKRGEPILIWSKGEAPEPKWTQDNFFGV
jgi:DNA modification methylase